MRARRASARRCPPPPSPSSPPSPMYMRRGAAGIAAGLRPLGRERGMRLGLGMGEKAVAAASRRRPAARAGGRGGGRTRMVGIDLD